VGHVALRAVVNAGLLLGLKVRGGESRHASIEAALREVGEESLRISELGLIEIEHDLLIITFVTILHEVVHL